MSAALPSSNVICIVVERLHAGIVGAYGNSWAGTAALDELASQSFVFDQAYLESPGLPAFYRAAWQARHAVDRRDVAGEFCLPELLSGAGMQTALITDSAEVAELPGAAHFGERRILATQAQPASAAELEETELAQLFGTASEWLAGAAEPFCLWIHSRGMAGAWDAPLAMRDRFAEEDDPQPPRLVTPPNHWLADKFDPDEPLGIKHAYAGQVQLLDTCLGGLLDALAESPLAGSTQVTFLSSGGFPLGEHRRIGACDEALYNEALQLVWMMRFPNQLGRLARSQALVCPSDFAGTLVDWLGLGQQDSAAAAASSLLPVIRGELPSLRDRLPMIGPHDHGLRTAAWHLRAPLTGAAELYAKPSDRWEVSEVASLLPEVLEGMQAALAEALSRDARDQVVPLPELLTTQVD